MQGPTTKSDESAMTNNELNTWNILSLEILSFSVQHGVE
jgi:hypothetical protein